jgi:hypothetical protein
MPLTTDILARVNGAHEVRARGDLGLVRACLDTFDKNHSHQTIPAAAHDLARMLVRGGVADLSAQASATVMASLALWLACRERPEVRHYALTGGYLIVLDITTRSLEPGDAFWLEVEVLRQEGNPAQMGTDDAIYH